MNRNWDRGRLQNLLPKQGDWFRIVNLASGDAEIYIFDEISYFGITADDFVRELKGLQAKNINVHINSKGGDVFDGVAIYNALRQHPAQITTIVDSLAASIASVIAQAGDERVMVGHSQMMIHDAFAAGVGNAESFREFADLLDKQSDLIASIYAERSGDADAQSSFRKLMRAETWLTDQEAVDAGLADRVEVPESVQEPAAKTTAPIKNEVDWVSVFSEAAAGLDPLEALV